MKKVSNFPTFYKKDAWVEFIFTNSFINWVRYVTRIMFYHMRVFIYMQIRKFILKESI